MKKFFSILAVLSLVMPSFGLRPVLTYASSNIFADGFEPSFSNWTSVDQSSGSNKGWKIVGSGYEGAKRATAEGNGANKVLLKEVSTLGMENISISFYHKDNGLEEADSVNVEYFNGTSWVNIVTFTDGNEVNNSSTGAWVNFSESLGSDANNLSSFAIRFVSTLDAAGDNFDLDALSVTGDEIDEEVNPEVPPAPVCNPEVNLIENGSFEEPQITNPDLWDIFTSVPGWNIFWVNNHEATPSLELQGGWLPALGSQYAELDGDLVGPNQPTTGGSTRISQTIDTVPGKTYKLNLSFSGRPNTDDTQNVLGLTWGGVNIPGTPLVLSNLVNQTNWHEYTFDLVATSSVTEISFMDQGEENSLGTFLDDVSLYCQPEPVDPCTYGSQVIYSDTNHTVDEGSSVATWVHPYWVSTSSPAIWMWSDTTVQNPTEDEVKVFTKSFNLTGMATNGLLSIAADNSYEVKINGHIVASTTDGDNFANFTDYNVTGALHYGENTIEITVHNFKPVGFEGTSESNPAGVIYALYVDTKMCPGDGEGENKPDAYVDIEKTGTYNHETGMVTFNIAWEVEEGLAEDLVITDEIPDGLTFVSADNSGVESGGIITWNLGDQNNANGTVSFTAKLDAFTSDIMWANGAVENNQGKRKDGSAVLGDRSVLSSMFGAAETLGNPSDTVVPGSFFALGFDAGSVVLTFPGTVVNGTGQDIQVFETTGGTYPDEKVKIEAWDQEDSLWVNLGTVTKDGYADISPLTYTTAIRLTEASDKSLFENTADGYDVDAVKVMNILPEVCSIENTALFTATTNDKNLSGNDSYELVINPHCDKSYEGEDEDNDNDPEKCEEGFVLEGESCVPEDNGGEGEGEEDGDTTPPPAAQSTQIPGGRRRDVSSLFSSAGGEVLGASTDENLTCEPYLKEYIKFGADNNPEEVKKLQIFLNQFFELDNPVTGFYGPITFEMVKKFQAHQEAGTLTPWMVAGVPTDGPTGYVYKTTKRWINILKCPEMIYNTPVPNLP